MTDRNVFLAVILAALVTGCGSGFSLDLSNASLHLPFAIVGGPYAGLAGLPVQFDGSDSSDDEGHSLTYEWDFGDGGTSTLVMPTHIYADAGTYTVTLRVCDSIAKCNINSGITTAVIASPANASPGGIWFGADTDGNQIVALITETGRFHFFDDSEFQGSGILTVSADDEITAGFRMLSPLDGSFADGTISANCSLDGSIVERATLDGTVDCTFAGGTQSSVMVNLNYQALYEMDSSLAAFSGTWTDSSNPGGDVVNVDAMGIITGQDGSGSNCHYSGQVSIIEPNFNAYDIEWTYSHCMGQAGALNGVTFSGIGAIDNTVSPAEFVFVATGVMPLRDVSWVLFYERT